MLEFHKLVSRLRDAFSELYKTIISIACILPVSTCECERSFSTLRLVKNYLRTSMGGNRLNSLMLLGIHDKRAEQLNLNTVVDKFGRRFPKCRIVLK